MKEKVKNLFLQKLNPMKILENWIKMKGFKKWFLLFVFLLLIIIIGRQVSAIINKGKPDYKKFQPVKVEKQDIQRLISKEGILKYSGVVDFYSPSVGVVADVFVKDGDKVKEGQKIITVKSTANDQEKAESLSKYITSKAALENAKTAKITSQADLEAARYEVLKTSQDRKNMEENRWTGEYTENEIEMIKSKETQARAKFAAAENEFNSTDTNIQAAQAALNSSWLNYQSTKDLVITSPVNGRLVNFNLVKRETIDSKTAVLFRIISSDDLMIVLKVSETEILRFQIGQDTEFTISTYPDQKFKGKVIAIDSLGAEKKGDNGSTTEYTVKIKPENIDKKILSPATVDTETVVEQKNGVLVVPNSAVKYSTGKRTVSLVKNGRVENKEVVLGIISDENTEIISGLNENDVVLIPKIGQK